MCRNYRRSLNLNEAIAHVSYEKDGVAFQREYFASYPDNVIVIRLTADQKGALSFTVRPEIPYLAMKQRKGSITAEGTLLTLKGTMALFSCNYEGQIKVLNEGGSVSVNGETIEVSKADAVTLLMTTGTNYRLHESTFSNPPAEKLDPKQFPHDEVSARIQAAQTLGYAALKKRHLQDYQNLFGRVAVNLNSKPTIHPTHLLLERYQKGENGSLAGGTDVPVRPLPAHFQLARKKSARQPAGSLEPGLLYALVRRLLAQHQCADELLGGDERQPGRVLRGLYCVLQGLSPRGENSTPPTMSTDTIQRVSKRAETMDGLSARVRMPTISQARADIPGPELAASPRNS